MKSNLFYSPEVHRLPIQLYLFGHVTVSVHGCRTVGGGGGADNIDLHNNQPRAQSLWLATPIQLGGELSYSQNKSIHIPRMPLLQFSSLRFVSPSLHSIPVFNCRSCYRSFLVRNGLDNTGKLLLPLVCLIWMEMVRTFSIFIWNVEQPPHLSSSSSLYYYLTLSSFVPKNIQICNKFYLNCPE